MTLSPGTRLGPYEILAPLGAGGMGEVYKARDTRLGRVVAIKILLERHAEDPAMLERFEREARAISALAHPSICTLHDMGEHEGTHFLVMEYLEGETLAARLARGPLPLDQVLGLGTEIASALAAAHGSGVVHRDFKPGNIMLTKAGPKLLDFGLAKLHAASQGIADPAAQETVSGPLTERGAILGTLQYMAPEQLVGLEADARGDIFAFGCVLYEMVSGRRAFVGETHASVAAAIVHEEPPSLASLQPMTPPTLERLVRACLVKDPDARWHSAADLARELRWVAEGPAAGSVAVRVDGGRRGHRERVAWAVAAAAILVGALAALLSRQSKAPEELVRFTIQPPSGQANMPSVQLSPDGRRVLLLLVDDAERVWVAVRSLDALEVRRVAGAEGVRGGFWSADGREIAFFADGKLKRVGLDGGAVQTICDSGSAFSGAWGPDGTILFEKDWGGPILAVPASGGTPRQVTALDTAGGDVAHAHPAFLPDGKHFVFVAPNVDLAKTSIVLASLESKESRRLFHADSSAVFAEPGYLLFGRDDVVFAWRFDPHHLELVGEPIPAFQQVHWLSADDLLGLSAARDRVAYLSWSLRRQLVWVDRTGREIGTLGRIGAYTDVRISPDGRSAAVAARDPSRGRNLDIWVLDATRGTETRITSDRNDEFNPAWFPDGERLVYVSDRFGFYDVYERPTSGGVETTLVRTKRDKLLPTVLPDGRHLLVDSPEGGLHARVLIDLAVGGSALPLSAGARFSEEHPEISPDGRWTAFDSDESGQREVFVQPLPQGPKHQVSIGGGQLPVWNRNGSELFYAGRDGNLRSVALHLGGGSLEIGEPQSLFPLRLGVTGELPFHVHPYDVSPDGQRFLVIRRAPDAEPDGAVVVTNWTAVLRRAP